jgi:very-short-patch-repair endonuclease
MPQLSPALSAVVRTRHGIVTTEQLLADGIGVNPRRRLVSAGSLLLCHKGVYRVSTAPDTFESRCVAACLADPESVVGGPAAARLWGFRHVFHPEQPILLVRHDRTPLSRGAILRRTNRLDPGEWIIRADGIRISRPVRAWFDCARDLNDEKFEMLTEWVIDRHAPVTALWRLARRMNGRGRPGMARVNRVLSQRPTWQRPAGSGLEVKVLNALEHAGVGVIVRQHPIRLANGIVIHPDGALPALRWAVEIDHVTWHGGRLDSQRDKGRDRALHRIGWQVDRVTDVEIKERFAATIAELVDLVRERVNFVRQ